jgi:hypothetical protein
VVDVVERRRTSLLFDEAGVDIPRGRCCTGHGVGSDSGEWATSCVRV